MKRFVFFDLGNVLVKFDHELAVRQLAAVADRPLPDVRAAVFESHLQTRFETGLIGEEDFVTEVNRRLDTRLPADRVLESISAIFEPNVPILQALEKLTAAQIPLGILSNTCSAHWGWLCERRWPMLGEWFQQVVLSYQVRSMKPDAGIYEASENLAGCVGSQIFFTDDRADNIAAAARRGWVTHQFRELDGLLASLDHWLAT